MTTFSVLDASPALGLKDIVAAARYVKGYAFGHMRASTLSFLTRQCQTAAPI